VSTARLLLGGAALGLAALAVAADPRRIAISGEPLENLLGRSDRPSVAAAIVRPEPLPAPDAWVVEEAITANAHAGLRLDFAACAPVLRIGSTPEYIRSHLAAPVVEGAVLPHPRELVLPAGKEIADFASPRDGDRFLLLFEPRPDGRWAFAVQMVGDLYLLRGERAFRLSWVQREVPATITSEPVWVSLGDVSAANLLERVRTRAAGKPTG